jgi:hypothetical protein
LYAAYDISVISYYVQFDCMSVSPVHLKILYYLKMK